MSEKSLVRVHSPNGRLLEVTTLTYHHQIPDILPSLFEREFSLPIEGTGFRIESSVSSKTHVFIARERMDPSLVGEVRWVIDVFAVRGVPGGGGGLTLDDVFNLALSSYPGEFVAEDRNSLTAYSYDENMTGGCNGFPCGSIFTINSFNVSPSTSPPLSLSPPYMSYQYPPLMNPTPVDGSSDESHNSSTRKGQVVDETPPGDLLRENPYGDFRKAIRYNGRHLQLVGEVVTDTIDRGDEAHTPITTQQIPDITIEDHCDDNDGCNQEENGVSIVVSPHEESSMSSEKSPSVSSREIEKREEGGGDVIPTLMSATGMVTGHLPSITRSASFHTTLPPPQLQEPQRQRRNSHHAFSHGPSQENQIRNGACQRDQNVKELEEVKEKEAMVVEEEDEKVHEQFVDNAPLMKPGKLPIPFHRSISGPSTTPVRDSTPPLVLQRDRAGSERNEEREERREEDGDSRSHGKNEFVVGNKASKVNSSQLQQRRSDSPVLPSPSNIAVKPISEVVKVEGGGNRDVPGEVVEGGDNVPPLTDEVSAIKADNIPDDGVLGGQNEPVMVAPLPTLKTADSPSSPPLPTSPSSSSSSSSGTSDEDEEVSDEEDTEGTSSDDCDEELDQISFDQVHLLEHVCNGQCWMESCPSHKDPSFPEQLEQMKILVAKLRDSGNDVFDMKRYIRFHCSRFCPGENCKVPHLAAGCPPPCLPSPKKPSPASSAKGCVDVSFDDRMAFDSRTPETNENVPGVPEQRPSHLPLPHPPQSAVDTTPTRNPYRHHQQPVQSPYNTPHGVLSPGRKFTQVNSPCMGLIEETKEHQEHPLCVNATPNATSLQGKAQQISSGQEGGGANNKLVYQYQTYDRRMRGMSSQSSRVWSLPDVCRDGFPEYSTYKSLPPGAIIYGHKDMSSFLMPGTSLPLPSDRDTLGKGGNGGVFKHYISKEEFAVKKTGYRPAELNTWKDLDHPNLVSLRGVMVGRPSIKTGNIQCYQFMERMTGNLSNMVRKIGCLTKLSKEEDPAMWCVVIGNVMYISWSVLKALKYLDEHNIQHCDVKGSNVLIRVPDSCKCQDILHCTCPEDQKYEVKLADFDSVKKSQSRRDSCTLPDVECQMKSLENRKKVMGTPAYRPFEQFSHPVKGRSLLENVVNGTTLVDLEGPWCDIWSLGVVLLRICLGEDTEEDKHDANILNYQPHLRDLNTTNESTHAVIKLKSLCREAFKDSNLIPLAGLAERCLTINLRKRPSAEEVLRSMH